MKRQKYILTLQKDGAHIETKPLDAIEAESLMEAAAVLRGVYTGENSLYKNPDDGAYYLLVRKMDTDPEQFNRICNVLSEYAMPMDYATGMDEFFREHMKVILSGTALQDLRKL